MRLGYACCFVRLTQVHFVYSGLCALSAQIYYSIAHHITFLLLHPTFVYYSCQIPMSIVQTLMLLDISQVFYIYWCVIFTSCAYTLPSLHLTGGLSVSSSAEARGVPGYQARRYNDFCLWRAHFTENITMYAEECQGRGGGGSMTDRRSRYRALQVRVSTNDSE